MKVNIVADIFGDSGYACHGRSLSNALMESCPDIKFCITCNKPNNWVTQVNDNELKAMTTPPDSCDMHLLITMPTVAPYYLCEGKPILQFVVWEGDKIPEYWLPILKNNLIKKILVPSNHTKDAIINTDKTLADKIILAPHGVDQKLFYPKPELKDKPFTFFCDKGFPQGTKDRGGLSFLMKAFSEEFNAAEDVKLLVKINMAYGMNQQMLDKHIKDLNIKNKTPAKMEIIPQNVPFEKLNDIYNKAHVFVIPSLAEAFHLGGIQAMACGLPVLSTTFGGQADYVNKDNGWLLQEGKMREVDWDVMYEGVSWKIPDIVEMKKTLRNIYENRNNINDKSTKAIDTSKAFNWCKTALIISDLIKGI